MKINRFYICFLSFFVIVSPCSNATALTLNARQVLSISVATQALTRITAADKLIQDVFVHPAEVQGHVQLHKGHVFVAPQGLSVKNPLFITILTEDGIVQDLKLIPGGKKAAPIVLESADAAPKIQTLGAIMADFVSGKVAPGFLLYGIAPDRMLLKKDKRLTIRPLNSFTNGQYVIHHYLVATDKSHNIQLHEKYFTQPGDVVVALTQHSVTSKQHALLLIARFLPRETTGVPS